MDGWMDVYMTNELGIKSTNLDELTNFLSERRRTKLFVGQRFTIFIEQIGSTLVTRGYQTLFGFSVLVSNLVFIIKRVRQSICPIP